MASSQSTCVYVKDDEHGWLPASVISYDGDGGAKVSVACPSGGASVEQRDVDLTDYEAKALPLQNADESGNLIEMADMCDLPSLHEPAILYNLKARHQAKKPYTRVGDIIIAMNPFQWIDGLYSDEIREEYVDKLIWSTAPDGDPKAGLDPHVYETSSLAYRGLAINGHHQSILVTGESGAGKTESVKIIMSHLASIQSTGIMASDDAQTKEHISHDPRSNTVVRRVLDSNPLLEAFGNAKTLRNDNSSRFGKYIQLQFDVEDATTAAFKGKAVPSCLLAGSNCDTYLLEKSRVVGHEQEERTYHIFYQLLAAPQDVKAEVWDGLMGADNSSFKYVGHTDTTTIEGRTDAEKWQRTVDALATVGVVGDGMTTLMRAVCTVLQLGNLEFDADPSNDDGSVISSTGELAKLAGLMGVETVDINDALTNRSITAGKESYSVPLKPGAARDGRDAFAKEIYQQTFDWLVRAINGATSAEANYSDSADVDEFGIIGLLDIFGFESFQVNRFEQLCINYANEKLQQKYTLDIFQSVQEEYEFEGIELGDVTFSDNSDVLTLIEGRMGIVAVLNEECVRPNGNDATFVNKVKTVNKDIECLINEQLHRPTEFAIQHYAGAVKYDATNFVQKNMDTLAKDLVDCACKSTNGLIRTELQNAVDAKAEMSKPGRGRGPAVTVSANFRSQLTSLMQNIGQTRTRYVRCIKPNPEKKPVAMDLKSSTEQLRCAGVVAAVNVSRAVFPNRLMHQTALERFQYLSSAKILPRHESGEEKKDDDEDDSTSIRSDVETLLNEVLKEMEVTGKDGVVKPAFCCGKSRVYFRAGALERLESDRLEALGVFAIVMERMARGFTARSKFTRTKEATVSSQKMARRTIARKDFLQSREAATAMSCWVRCIFAKMKLVRLRRERACTLLQTRCRIHLAKAELKSSKSSAVSIQKIARGSQQRPIYRAMLKEAREEAVVNKKLAALQKRLADAEMKWMQADKKRIEAEKRADGTGAELAVEDEKKEEVSEVSKQLMDESVEMLEVLKKDIFNLRSKNFLLRTDYNELKDAYQHLAAQNTAMVASHEALKLHATQLGQANKSMLFKASKEKKEHSDMKKEFNTDKFKLRGEVATLKRQLEAKDKAHEKELEELRKELFSAKEKIHRDKSTRPVKQPSSTKKPVMQRASFNARSASFHTGKSFSSNDEEGSWDHSGYYQMYGNESRNPRATAPSSRSRGRRSKGRSPRGNRRQPSNRATPPSSRNSSRASSRNGRREPPKSSGSRASAGHSGSAKGIPRVTSRSSLTEAAEIVSKANSKSSLAAAASKGSSQSQAKGGKQKH